MALDVSPQPPMIRPRAVSAPKGAATVPPFGPPWFGAVMGTSILATLSELRTDVIPFGVGLGQTVWGIALVMLVVLVLGFSARIIRHPAAFAESCATPVAAAQWGMVAMGLLSFGSATAAVVPTMDAAWAPTAWNIDLGFFIAGTAIGAITACGVPARLLRSEPGTPTTVWGLAVVPPMVSATVGAGLIPHLGTTLSKVMMLAVAIGGFFMALSLAPLLFAIACRHHWLREPLPIAASISAWLPLGVVGQSTAAAASIAKSVKPLVTADVAHSIHQLADIYGYVMMSLGIPLCGWALAMTVRGFKARMGFNPGWWGMTFPVGTLVLGTTLLGRGAAHPVMTDIGGALYLFLLVTWTTCVVASVRAIAHR